MALAGGTLLAIGFLTAALRRLGFGREPKAVLSSE